MSKKEVLFGLAVAVFLAVALSPFASPWLDGLERVAEDKGFLEKGEGAPLFRSPIPDYALPNIQNEKLATAAAGAVGTIIVFAVSYGLGVAMKRKL